MIEKQVYQAVHRANLTPQQRRDTLRAVNLIKEKRSGLLKGRHCADGHPQRKWYEKHETSSPTVSVDALFATLLVGAFEQWDVAIYLNAVMDTFILMRLEGDDVDLMCEVSPEFCAYVAIEQGRSVLYLRLARALYGCVQSALLWYKLFKQTLQQMGFTVNPYDACVANAEIEGSQCTVAWYIDNNKISHKNPAVVTQVIQQIEDKLGKMTVSRGKQQSFLGMQLDFGADRTISISMRSYLQEVLEESGLTIRRHATTPATKTIYNIDPSSPFLEPKTATTFHSVVSKLLYVALRGCPDLLVAISFLSTRVAQPTEQDLAKLQGVLEYIAATLSLVLCLGADDLNQFFTFVDAAYNVHEDYRSHTGGMISFGRGGLINGSTKQKLNTKSSTKAQLVGASDYLSNGIWLQNFMTAQGYPPRTHWLIQDNESAIKMEKNGQCSMSQRSRHIDSCYFWIADRLQRHHIGIQHWPTHTMLADFLTKPMQGSLFCHFCDILLGSLLLHSLRELPADTTGERVGKPVAPETGTPDIPQGSDCGEQKREQHSEHSSITQKLLQPVSSFAGKET